MEIGKLRVEIADLTSSMKDLGQELKDLSERLLSKELVDQSKFDNAIKKIGELIRQQDKLRNNFSEVTDSEVNLPTELDKAEEILSEIEDKLYKAPLLETVNDLRCITARTVVAEHLRKIVQDAEELYNSGGSAEELSKKLEPYRTFVDAVRCVDGNERIKLAQNIRSLFPADLISGVLFGEFTYSASHLAKKTANKSEETPDTSAQSELQYDSRTLEQEIEKILNKRNIDNPDDIGLERIKEIGLRIGVRGTEFEYTLNKGDTTPISFGREQKGVKKLLEQYGNMGLMEYFSKYPTAFAETLENKFDNQLETMLNRGYLNTIERSGASSMYFIGEKGCKAFKEVPGLSKDKQKTIRQAVNSSPYDNFGEDHPCYANNVMTYLGMTALMVRINEIRGKQFGVSSVSSHNCSLGESVFANTRSTSAENSYLLVSVVPSCDEAVLLMLSAIESEMSEKNFGTLLIAAEDICECEKLLRWFEERYSEKLPKRIGIYSVTENEFRDIETPDEQAEEADADPEMEENMNVTDNGQPEESIEPEYPEGGYSEEISGNKQPAVPGTAAIVKPADDEPENELQSDAVFNIDVQTVRADLRKIIDSDKLYCACAYMNILHRSEPKSPYSPAYKKMAYAVDDPAHECRYSPMYVMGVFGDMSGEELGFEDYLYLSAALRTLFCNSTHGDYGYQPLMDTVKDFADGISPKIGKLLYSLRKFIDNHKVGIDAFANYRIKNQLAVDEIIKEVVTDANKNYHQYIESQLTETIINRRFIETKKLIFRRDNALAECLDVVAKDNREMRDYVVDFLNDNNFLVEGGKLSDSVVNAYIDHFWIEAEKFISLKHASSMLTSRARSSLLSKVNTLLTILRDWVNYTGKQSFDYTNGSIEKDKKAIAAEIDAAIADCVSLHTERIGLRFVTAVLHELKARISNPDWVDRRKYFYIDFLRQEHIVLNDNCLPFDDSDCTAYFDGYSMRERIIRHSENNDRPFRDRLDEIFGETAELKDDYGSARLIIDYLNAVGEECKWSADVIDSNSSNVVRDLDNTNREFVERLELDQSLGKLDDINKEIIRTKSELMCQSAKEMVNFGYYNRFISACNEHIVKGAESRGRALEKSIEHLEGEYGNSNENEFVKKLITQAKVRLKEQDYTVVEDIINRIERNDLDDYMSDHYVNHALDDYLREFNYLYSEVKPSGQSGTVNINQHRASNREERFANALIANFPFNGTGKNADKIEKILSALNFNIELVERNESMSEKNLRDVYNVQLKHPISNTKQNYTHPIAPFGSVAVDNGFRVVCFYGNHTADELIKKFSELGDTKNCMVFLDYPMTLPARRELALKLKEKAFTKIFIVIDGTIAKFLSLHASTASVNRMLMEITMPFSYYQPYTVDSSHKLPIEMFMGRMEQLKDIKQPSGANIVYGGRQLGKTAILKMAQNEIDHNENGDRAVYIDVKDDDYRKAAMRISGQLILAGILPEGSETDDWYTLCYKIQKRLDDTSDRIPYLLLLIDEADAFIESCKADNYGPIGELKNLQLTGMERFKFVIAGLRNVVRFDKERAQGNNSVLAQLRSTNIAPFTAVEARELLEVPLHYLGIRFPQEKKYLISNILANTNYFPGLIHTYCAKLVEAMRNENNYYPDRNPPYEINENHLKKVLASPQFREEVVKKFTITLELGEDKYYSIIANIMAYCFNNNENVSEGFSAEEIYRTGAEFEIKKFADLNADKVAALMDEMCQLNVLTHNRQFNTYSFARHNFIQMLGNSDKIEQKIISFAEG